MPGFAPLLGVLPYPQIDPVAFSLGPFALRWYALAYLTGVLFAWWLMRRTAYAAATGSLHGPIARAVERRDKAEAGLGSSWTHADERERDPVRAAALAERRAAAKRAAAQRKRTLHAGRGAQRRQRRHAQSEQRQRLEAEMKAQLRGETGGAANGGAANSGAMSDGGGANKGDRGGGKGGKGSRPAKRGREAGTGASTGKDAARGGKQGAQKGAQKSAHKGPAEAWTFIPPAAVDEFVTWSIFGIILGGRLGYVLGYNLPYFADHPTEALYLWQGGMSFHGGAAGVLVAAWLYARRRRLPFLALADLCALGCTIGLFLGRIANFVNGELYGRASDAPWAMVFPGGGDEPRHPSQLYEALGEGLLLFLALGLLVRLGALYYHGMTAAAALIGYGAVRFALEFTREPDAQLGLLWLGLSAGQWLSIPMAALGVLLLSVRTGRIRAVEP